MARHYFFPQAGIACTVFNKCGNTSILNFLVQLETEIVQGVKKLSRDYKHFELTRNGNLPNSAYQIGNLIEAPSSAKKFVVIRDPRDRVLSAWLNKFLYTYQDYELLSKYQEADFIPDLNGTIAEHREKFLRFVRRLQVDAEFRNSDAHWRPISTSGLDFSDFDLILETRHLDLLPVKIGQLIGNEEIVLDFPMPKSNSTPKDLSSLVGTDEAFRVIDETYIQDVALLQLAGVEPSDRVRARPINPLDDKSVMEREKPRIEISRLHARNEFQIRSLELEIERISRQKSWIENSWSWRLTAFLRTKQMERLKKLFLN